MHDIGTMDHPHLTPHALLIPLEFCVAAKWPGELAVAVGGGDEQAARRSARVTLRVVRAMSCATICDDRNVGFVRLSAHPPTDRTN
jgi:hypothetical protein